MCGPTSTSAATTTPQNKNTSSDNFEKNKNETEDEKPALPTVEEVYDIKFSDFLDPSKPWVLVPNGSFRGNFNYVPYNLRVGPWNIVCCLYLAALTYWMALNVVDAFFSRPPPAQDLTVHATDTWQHWYNVCGFFWTTYVAYGVAKSNMSWAAWTTYTLQSWTLIIARHGLSALAPYIPAVSLWNEYLRFPMLLQSTVTFVIWNFALMPVIWSQIKTSQGRKEFIQFCFGFLLTQLHVLNIVFAGINGIWATPAREFTRADFAVALLFALQYILFYLMILDRLGIHYYMIFSPRSKIALLSWSGLLACIYGGFAFWKNVILQYGTA